MTGSKNKSADGAVKGSLVVGQDALEIKEQQTIRSEDEESSTTNNRPQPLVLPSSFTLSWTQKKSRQYIIDRCNGQSKIDGGGTNRPPLRPCWPPPCVQICSDCCEQNVVCECVGRIGLIEHDHAHHDKIRMNVFRVAVWSNVVAFVFSLFACLAISNEFHLLKIASFSSGAVSVRPQQNHTTSTNFTSMGIYVGLRAVAFENLNSDINIEHETGAYRFDEFCHAYNTKIEGSTPEEWKLEHEATKPRNGTKICETCQKASSGLVSSAIMGVLTMIPTLTTDFNRMYSNYDVNCQKFFGCVVSTFGMLLSLYTLAGYRDSCSRSLYEGEKVVNMLQSGKSITVLFDWAAGNGLVAMYLATALKSVDILANLVIPTPTITRNQEEQQEYEALYGSPSSSHPFLTKQETGSTAAAEGSSIFLVDET